MTRWCGSVVLLQNLKLLGGCKYKITSCRVDNFVFTYLHPPSKIDTCNMAVIVDAAMAMLRSHDDNEAMLHRAIIIASSHYRAIDFAQARFHKKNIVRRHINGNKGILDSSAVPLNLML